MRKEEEGVWKTSGQTHKVIGKSVESEIAAAIQYLRSDEDSDDELSYIRLDCFWLTRLHRMSCLFLGRPPEYLIWTD